jgi:hypothetical protein
MEACVRPFFAAMTATAAPFEDVEDDAICKGGAALIAIAAAVVEAVLAAVVGSLVVSRIVSSRISTAVPTALM